MEKQLSKEQVFQNICTIVKEQLKDTKKTWEIDVYTIYPQNSY